MQSDITMLVASDRILVGPGVCKMMRYVLGILLLCVTAEARQVHWANRDAEIRRQQTLAVLRRMNAWKQAEEAQRAVVRQQEDPQHRERQKQWDQARQALLERAEQKKKDERFLALVASQPKPEVCEYQIYLIKKKYGWLPLDDFAKWKQTTDYYERKRRKPVVEEKKVSQEELDRALGKALLDALQTGHKNTPRKNHLEDEE